MTNSSTSVSKLTFSDVKDDTTLFRIIEAPTDEQIEMVVRSMNGAGRRFVSLQVPEVRLVMLHEVDRGNADGEKRLHILYSGPGVDNWLGFAVIIDPDVPDTPEWARWKLTFIETNGEETISPIRESIPKDAALYIALHVFREHELPQGIQWVEF